MSACRRLGLVALVAVAVQPAWAATLSLEVASEALYADMPFTLTLSARGFEEEPTPEPPELAIDGCEVTYLGVGPSAVSTHIQVINGRRSEWREVVFKYRWRVYAPAPGRYTVPPLRLEQAGTVASSQAATFDAREVPKTKDMVVRMALPDRTLWVGETFEATVEWLIARDARNQQFSVPLFNLDGAEVSAPSGAAPGQSVAFDAGTARVELPMARSNTRLNNLDFLNLSFPAQVTLNRSGVVDLAPVGVVAELQSGSSRDSWGFSRKRYQLFQARGEPRRLTVRPLPVAGRPPTFANAIGGGFAIDVQASRTVVSVGEPVEVTIRLRGDVPLTGLGLPPLSGPDGLPPALFQVPDGSIAGEIDEDTNSKRFVVTVRVKSAEVSEIPPLAFSYFDPAAGEYRTVTSQPVALSVGAGHLVGVDDVVAAASVAAQSGRELRSDGQGTVGIATLVGADMSLSAAERTFARPWGAANVRVPLAALYVGPLLLGLIAIWMAQSGGRRAHSRTVRQALRMVEKALASRQPAPQAVPAIVTAVRRLADVSGGDPGEAAGLIEQLQTRAYDPALAEQSIPDGIADELRRIARDWTRRPPSAASSATAALLAVVGLWAAGDALAVSDADTAAVDEARALYRAAIEEPDRLRRVRLFANAELSFRPLAMANAGAPELQVDWGNAALGAQDLGRAMLAYRRALDAAPGNDRARANLDWLRNRLPVWLPRPGSSGALDSLLFWRERLSTTQLLVAGAACFAIGVLLVLPWPGRPRWLGGVAIPLLLVWILATGSALFADDIGDDAIVLTDGATLRSADSAGASPTFANPLPAGTEVTVLERRDTWVRVSLADGTRGWLAASAVAWISP